jgi:SAM-dependent methyltransferase
MLFLDATRRAFLEHLPKGGAWAEVGVADGDHAARILELAQPSVLHLIDPWLHWERKDYQTADRNLPQDEQDRAFEAVRQRFAPQIASGQVVLHRATSMEAVERLPEGSLDAVYIDGMHTYDAVLEDLEAWSRRVRPGGVLLGDDYAEHAASAHKNFGVIGAVTAWKRRRSWRMVALTRELYPSYLLAPPGRSPWASHFMRSILESKVEMIDIPESLAASFHHRTLQRSDGSYRVIPGF